MYVDVRVCYLTAVTVVATAATAKVDPTTMMAFIVEYRERRAGSVVADLFGYGEYTLVLA